MGPLLHVCFAPHVLGGWARNSVSQKFVLARLTRPGCWTQDLGGVVLESPLPAIRAFEKDAGVAPGAIFTVAAKAGSAGAWQRLERGEVTLEEFLPIFASELSAAGLVLKRDVAELFVAMEAGAFFPPLSSDLGWHLYHRALAFSSSAGFGGLLAFLASNQRHLAPPPTLTIRPDQSDLRFTLAASPFGGSVKVNLRSEIGRFHRGEYFAKICEHGSTI